MPLRPALLLSRLRRCTPPVRQSRQHRLQLLLRLRRLPFFRFGVCYASATPGILGSGSPPSVRPKVWCPPHKRSRSLMARLACSWADLRAELSYLARSCQVGAGLCQPQCAGFCYGLLSVNIGNVALGTTTSTPLPSEISPRRHVVCYLLCTEAGFADLYYITD
ncbi:hypothetical protein ZWY2020_059426 [Hordeum vulgare]|nr:hypothetical protein ZWY2020_059426 [Hordeum vulgare]